MLRRAVLSGFIALAAGLAALTPAQAREITHAMGTTDAPDAPKRVVVLTMEGTEALLALGVTPVGAVRSATGNPWYPHIAGKLGDTQVVGEESAVNLEAIAALEPDLIIGNKMRQEKIYDQLSAIAPTIESERLRGDWKTNFVLYADALNKKAEGEALIAQFDNRVKALGDALGDAKNEKISLVRFIAGKTRIYYHDTFAGIILDQIGFKRPAPQDRPDFADDVTKERIPEMDGDRLFYYTFDLGDGGAEKQAGEWMQEPLWQNLPVVKAQKAFPVDDAIWNTAGGYIAANLMLDDIAKVYGVTLAQ